MKLEGTIYCEGPDCERSAHIGVPNMNAGRLPPGFLRIVEYGDAGQYESAYCGWDCVLRAAGQHEPEEIIPMDGGE